MNDFDKWSMIPLEQWIYFLNTGEIPDDATAPGLPEARERLQLDRLSKDELNAYYRHLDNVVILRDNIFTEREEGRWEGLMEGREEGKLEGKAEGEKEKALDIARKLKLKGISTVDISDFTGISREEVDKL